LFFFCNSNCEQSHFDVIGRVLAVMHSDWFDLLLLYTIHTHFNIYRHLFTQYQRGCILVRQQTFVNFSESITSPSGVLTVFVVRYTSLLTSIPVAFDTPYLGEVKPVFVRKNSSASATFHRNNHA
jgi:hypothetical protein